MALRLARVWALQVATITKSQLITCTQHTHVYSREKKFLLTERKICGIWIFFTGRIVTDLLASLARIFFFSAQSVYFWTRFYDNRLEHLINTVEIRANARAPAGAIFGWIARAVFRHRCECNLERIIIGRCGTVVLLNRRSGLIVARKAAVSHDSEATSWHVSRRNGWHRAGRRKARESSETMRDAALIFLACRALLSPLSLFLCTVFSTTMTTTTAKLSPAAARAPDCDRNSFVNYRILARRSPPNGGFAREPAPRTVVTIYIYPPYIYTMSHRIYIQCTCIYTVWSFSVCPDIAVCRAGLIP